MLVKIEREKEISIFRKEILKVYNTLALSYLIL